uniref:Integrase catalytic domain-containing protein n=1 Tax=Amphimedon queenslandica TaxID=400682 RepID=A0A1X7UVR5_AMPQE
SLKRFISRRRLPLRMISDNGSTFKAAARVLQKIVTDDSVSEYLTGMKIEWSFSIEKALWWEKYLRE